MRQNIAKQRGQIMQFLKPILAMTAVAALVAGCTDPYGQSYDITAPQNRNAAGGAIMGAATGALVSTALGGGGKENVASAVAGAAIGSMIGNQFDRQAADLQRDLGNGISVENQGDQLLVNFPQDILFATDSATVRTDQRDELLSLASNLQSYPNTTATIVGHTDNTGEASYNADLSNRRASSVASVLIGAGVSSSRVTATGRGEDAPIASNLTPEGRAKNRRVEVIIRPAG
jgi:outer membrane protein OmpA-like peptidoglycan-associated protein